MNTMNTKNANDHKIPRTNRITITVFIGVTTLLIGLFFGAAAAETGTGLLIALRKAKAAAGAGPATASGKLAPGSSVAWNPFRTNSEFDKFEGYPGYSLSLDVRDLKDHYEVLAYLPDAKPSDAKVSLNNGRTLDVQVNRQSVETIGQKNAATSLAEWSRYQQEIQLPTPAKAGGLKVQREGHELVITIPKAA